MIYKCRCMRGHCNNSFYCLEECNPNPPPKNSKGTHFCMCPDCNERYYNNSYCLRKYKTIKEAIIAELTHV